MSDQSPQPRQKARGSYIAQADRGGVAQVITNIFQGGIDEARELRYRRSMLQLVWNTWIEGMLKQSLYNEVLIELGMQTKPDAVEHPWDMVIQMPDREPRPVAPGITMLELLDQTNGSLIILGEPGSGKTTMLLELCRQLIERARQEALQQIPVVFNLSSWRSEPSKQPEQGFADWLLGELRDRYFVSNKIGRLWIENDEMVLLLDGLDEVREEYRETCVQAINAFREEHSVPLAVCCRRQEYDALTAHFKFRGAVLIQPLTDRQVDEYLQTVGPSLTSVRRALKRDRDMQRFAQTPLILSILILAYRNATNEAIRALETTGDYRKRLFDVYTTQMFKRRGVVLDYTPEKTRAWLSWLAQEMLVRRQTLFAIEDIQPSWLPFVKRKRRLVSGLIFGLIGGLSSGLIFGPISGLIMGLIGGLFFGLIPGLIVGLIMGLISGLMFWRIDFKPTEKLIPSWKQGLIFGLISGLFFGLIFGLINGLIVGLIMGLISGLASGLIVGLIFGLRSVAIEERSKPGEGIKTSLKYLLFGGLINGLIFGLFIGPYFALIMGLLVGLVGGPPVVLTVTVGWLSTALVGGLLGAWGYGGNFIILHFVSRWFLYRSGCIPWNLIAFLNHCKERIFLRQVGGGYIFIHRTLMEHFAEAYHETLSQKE